MICFINLTNSITKVSHIHNLCKSPIKSKSLVIDITNTITFNDTSDELIKPKSDPIGQELETNSNLKFANFVGTYSTQTILGRKLFDIQTKKVPLYWISSWAVKDYYSHWGVRLFFLIELINNNYKNIFEDERITSFHLILPDNSQYAINFIKENLLLKKGLNYSFYKENGIQKSQSFFRIILALIVSYFKVRYKIVKNKSLFKGNPMPEVPVDVLFVSNFPTSWQKNKYDMDLEDIFQIIDKPQKKFVPFFTALRADKFEMLNDYSTKFDIRYLDSYPSVFAFSSLIIESFVLQLKYGFYYIFSFKRKFIAFEILVANKKTDAIFSAIWLRNYLQKVPVKYAIYSDEFYSVGRIISSVFKDLNTVNIATQHGLMGDYHSTYFVSDAEIGNGIPMPKRFVLWSEYFKKYFLSKNSLSPEFIEIAGHPKYLKLKPVDKLENRERAKIILWCTTVEQVMLAEFELIISFLNVTTEAYKIVIRPHPTYDCSDKIKELLSLHQNHSMKFEFDSSLNIFEALNKFDFVFCSNTSTVFIDALVVNKTVLILDNPFTKGVLNSSVRIKSLYICKSAADIFNAIDGVSSEQNEVSGYDKGYLLDLSPDNWNKIIS